MGIFVGNAAEREKFKASGVKIAKGVIATGTQIPASNSGLLSKVANVAKKLAPVKVGAFAAGLAVKQAKANTNAATQIPTTNVGIVDKVTGFIKNNPTAAALAGGAALLTAGAVGYAVGKRKSKKKKSSSPKSKKSRSSRSRRRSARPVRSRRRSSRGYGTEAQYKRKGGKDVKYTKNGQPYVITSSGRARFIKRSR